MPLYSATCPLPKNQMLRRHSVFSPSNLTGLSLWLKADTGITLSGSDVTAWADQSGNGNDATATDTPTLSTVGGKTFVDFSSGYFSGSELLTTPYATIMCVARFTDPTTIGMMFEQYGGNEYDNLAFYRGFNAGSNLRFRMYNGIDLTSNTQAASNKTFLFGVTVDNQNGNLFLNATADGNGAIGEQTPEGSFYLGRFVGGLQTTSELRMAEIVVYNRVLTTIERQQVEAYLVNKYAIPIPNAENMFLPQLWLKADAGITLSGSDITAWADQSENANNATATGTPTLTTISGKTFVNFVGGYFTGNELITSPSATIIAVANFTAARQVEVIFQQSNEVDGDNVALYRGSSSDDYIFALYNGSPLDSTATTDDNVTYLFGSTVGGDSATLYLNAVQDNTGYCGEIAPAGECFIGRWVSGATTTTEMRMAEILVYNRVLSTQELESVKAYLNTKYSIY